MRAVIDISGKKFSRLTVVCFSHKKDRKTYWQCICECGNKKTVRSDSLKNGHTKSCGCYHKEQTSFAIKTHGMTGTPEYKCWTRMRERCHSKSDVNYKDYGERGISVCGSWRDSFINFYNDIGSRPSNKHSIERLNNNKGYSPENCKWATKKEQLNNTRRNHFITIEEKTLTLSQWSSISGTHENNILRRLDRGWTPELAVFKPVRKHKKIKAT